jgi:hypothetical protein
MNRIFPRNGPPIPHPPTLIPHLPVVPYHDYEALSQADKVRCERLIESILSSKITPTFDRDMYFKVMSVLHEKRRRLALAAQCLSADTVDEVMRRISYLFLEKQLFNSKEEHVYAVQIQYDIENQRLAELEREQNDRVASVEAEAERAIQGVEQECEERIRAFDDSIPQDLPPEYCKLSPDLLNVINQEKHLIGSRRFREADKFHREIVVRQKGELVQQRERYLRSFEVERVRIANRNKKAMDAVQLFWQRRIEVAKDECRSSIAAKRAAVENLWHKLIDARAEYIGEDDGTVLQESSEFARRLPTRRDEPVPRTKKSETVALWKSNGHVPAVSGMCWAPPTADYGPRRLRRSEGVVRR